MSNQNEPKITDMMRLACMDAYQRGETQFSFTIEKMASITVWDAAAKAGVTDESKIEDAIDNWTRNHLAAASEKFKSSFAVPIITRAFAKIGKRVKVSVGKDEDYNLQITVEVLEGEEPVIPKRKSQARKKFNVAECLDSFVVNVSKLSDGEVSVRDVNEVVEQMKAHIVKCGG